MPTFEVLIKILDSNPGNHSQKDNWEDGMVIGIMPRGFWWTAGQMNNWVQNGVEPPSFSTLGLGLRQRLTWLRHRFHQYTHVNFTRLHHINRRFDESLTQAELDAALAAPTPTDEQLRIFGMDEDCAGIEAILQKRIDEVVTHSGMDSNWSAGQLLKHGVVRVDATVRQFLMAFESMRDLSYHVLKQDRDWAKSGWRIDYQSFLTAPQIADLEDPTVHVQVDRVTAPVSAGAVAELVVRDLVGNPEGSGPGTDP